MRRVSMRMPWLEFALALSVLLAIAVASDTITSRLARDQDSVEHTYAVETAIAGARSELVSATEARQVYVLTDDSGALAKFQRSVAAIPGEISQLQDLTSDNPTQQTNLVALRNVVNQRIGILQQSINVRQEPGGDANQQREWTLAGMGLEDEALGVFDKMNAEEARLMTIRQTISEATYKRVRIVLVFSFAIAVLIITFSFYGLSRELIERGRAEQAVMQLSAKILRVQDDERRRVARELHDSIGQVFAALKMNLELAETTLTLRDPERTRELLAESVNVLEAGLSSVRTLSHLLHPPLLDEMGFATAAKWLVDGFSQRSNIQVKLEVFENLPRMPQAVELALFRILQEGLTNVHKHSESRVVEITVKADNDKVSIRMRDFGKGIPEGLIAGFRSAQPGLGVGLAGMRERLRDLGGHLDLKSDGGAIVEASIPLADLQAGESAGRVLSGDTPG